MCHGFDSRRSRRWSERTAEEDRERAAEEDEEPDFLLDEPAEDVELLTDGSGDGDADEGEGEDA
jgi:hypothetical protein